MKKSFLCALWALVLVALSSAGQNIDPTQTAAPMADMLKNQLDSFRSLRLAGLVCAEESNGVALLELPGGEPFLVREGMDLNLAAGGVTFRVKVKSVTVKGVELSADGLAEPHLVPVSLARPLPPKEGEAADGEFVRYAEFNQVPLRMALRMLADQGRRNYICSDAAAATAISLFLRNMAATEIVDELCKSHGLWYADRESNRNSVRIQTMGEFQESLQSFRQDEQSETFVLLYPNVIEVASIVQGLYADRVVLSLGDEDILDDELNDLSRRFERYDTINRAANNELMDDFNVQNSGVSGGRRGTSRNGGIYTLNQNGQLSGMFDRRNGKFRDLRVEDAEKLQKALPPPSADSGTAAKEQTARTLNEYRQQLPPIYVTVSRRNNMLIVRTSDPWALDDIRNVVKRVDKPTPMVLLEVKLLQIALSDDLETVFDYTAEGHLTMPGNHEGHWDGGGWQNSNNSLLKANRTIGEGMSFQIVNDHFTARIQALQKRGHTKVLATPTLLTANNEVSQLFIGEERPIVRDITSSTVVTERNVVVSPQTEIEFKRVGTQLLFTPSINADRTVTLRLLEQNSSVSPEKGKIPVMIQNSDDNGDDKSNSGWNKYVDVDIVQSRYVAGTFVAKDQMTVAVGGLIEETETDKVSGIPLLMDIPYLGWLFRSTNKVKSRSELIILITPHVISTPSEAEEATKRVLRENTRNPDANRYLDPEDHRPGLRDSKDWHIDFGSGGKSRQSEDKEP